MVRNADPTPKRMRWALLVVPLALLATPPVTAQTPEPLLTPANVTVDFTAEVGALTRTERFNNFANPGAFPEQRPGDAAFLNEQGLHGDIYRVWMDDDAEEGTGFADLCDVATGSCDFSSVAGYFQDASSVSDSLLMVVMPTTSIEAGVPPAETKPILKLIIKGLKERFPAIEYIEAFNEPDHKFGRQNPPIVAPDELYAYYVPIYEVVNEVNAELQPEVPLKIGGPAYSGFTTEWVGAFLSGYAADTNPGKRLDFVSWHGYGHFDEQWRFHMYKEDPSEVATHRAQLDEMLTARGLSTDLPAFITETGIYPGPSFDDPSGRTDYVRTAAGGAALQYWYASQPNTYPFNWVVRHGTDERKDQLVTRVLPGVPTIPGLTPEVGQPTATLTGIPTEIFTPYGNLLLMQSMMKTTQVAASSDSLHAGKGVYSLASKDGTGASVMVWNYQGIGATAFRAAIDMGKLPGTLRNKQVRERIFRIDQTTSNYFTSYDAEQAELQVVSDRTVTAGDDHATTVDLEPNAIHLVLLEAA